MQYGYIKDGVVTKVETPKKVVVGNVKYTNPTHERIIEAGYKEIKESDMPEYDETKQEIYTKVYENESTIHITYLVKDKDEEIPDDEEEQEVEEAL